MALLRDRQRGWREIADRVEDAGSALKVLEDELAGGQEALFADDDQLMQKRLSAARHHVLAWETEGLGFVTLLDKDYPSQLLTIHQRPPFLFYRGRLDPKDASGVAVVGTRHPSEEGVRRAGEIASGLARKGTTVISGLAAGIDSTAHRAAMAVGGRTVAVVGTGLRRAYPAENAALQDQLCREYLVLSQFWPDAAPSKTSFPMRNAVMSGYAAATVVVEASWQSGARMQARLALEHGRPVFLLDSLLRHDWAQQYAARPGTTVVHDADDVLGRLDELLTTPDELVWT